MAGIFPVGFSTKTLAGVESFWVLHYLGIISACVFPNIYCPIHRIDNRRLLHELSFCRIVHFKPKHQIIKRI